MKSMCVATLILAVLLLMLVSVPVLAETNFNTPGIHGEASFEYELAEYNPGQSWNVDLHYNFTSWLSIGMSQTTHTTGNEFIGFIPTFIPDLQKYEAYLAVSFGNATVKLSQWCDHPVLTNYNRYLIYSSSVPSGVCLSGIYRF